MAGRIILSKAVLPSIPIYLMQTNLLPLGVCDPIDTYIRKFIRGSSQSQRKIHLVPWNEVCCNKKDRGLGFRKSRLMNEVLMMKLAFALLKNEDTL